MNKILVKFWRKIISSYFYQFIILALLIFIGFYKVLDFTFHANREMAYIIGLTGGDYSFINLIKSHGFISLFNLKLFGPNPAGWYLTSIILHILAVYMLVFFVNSLTKDRVIGFLTGLWFGVNLAWHDVITFGSQQSMYAAELFLFFVAIFFYKRFRENHSPKLSYAISFICLAINLPLRELGLIFYPVVFFFDIVFYFEYKKTHSIKRNIRSLARFLIPQIPFIVASVAYFVFQQKYAEVPAYFMDDRVQFRANLLAQKHYLEYIIISFLSFGTFIPPHFIPYPVLNFLRNAVFAVLPIHFLKVYFFSLTGLGIYLFLIFLAYLNRKKHTFKILIFALLMIALPTIFYSTSISMDETRFLAGYEDEGNRYRYFAFVGTALFIIIFFRDYLKQKFKLKTSYKLLSIIVVSNLLLNIFFLWFVEDRMYKEMFKNQKLFYKTMLKIFPTYSKNNTLYNPPYSYSLGDYVSEWHHLNNFYYPGIGEVRKDWSYSEMEMVLRNIKENKLTLNDIFFIDFNPSQGVINYTEKARNEILNQKQVEVIRYKVVNEQKISIPIQQISPVEFPYDAYITLKADLDPYSIKDKKYVSKDKIDVLINYTNDHMELVNKTNIEVCATFGNFIAFDKKHLIDGNFGDRSVWNADCFPSWFILDLGQSYNVSGFLMKGFKDDPHLPRLYYYEISKDQKKWEKVLEINNNTRSDMMDKWPNSYETRYIKVTVKATQRLGFVSLSEVEPVLSQDEDVFKYWSNWEDLTNSMRKLLTSVDQETINDLSSKRIYYSFGKLSWETNLLNIPEDQTTYYFPFLADGQFHTYKIPIYESEMYSFRDQFLKRRITDISLDFTDFPGVVSVSDFKLNPRYVVN